MRNERKEYLGQKFNRLTILVNSTDTVTPDGLIRNVLCRCDCGVTKIIRLHSIRSGNTKSCGCQKIESTSKKFKTHGLTTTKLGKKVYHVWNDIKRRCYQENHPEFKRYGAKGITLQESWIDSPTDFYNYVSNLDNFRVEYSLDRIDNTKGYCEGNLRWATNATQTRNQSKQANNTSGQTGITWYENSTGGTRAIAWWYDGGKAKSKSFSCKKIGLLPAFAMAVDHREKMILKLNEQGAGYSDTHGK